MCFNFYEKILVGCLNKEGHLSLTKLDILFLVSPTTGLTLECFFSGKREEGNAGTVNRHHIQETVAQRCQTKLETIGVILIFMDCHC